MSGESSMIATAHHGARSEGLLQRRTHPELGTGCGRAPFYQGAHAAQGGQRQEERSTQAHSGSAPSRERKSLRGRSRTRFCAAGERSSREREHLSH